MSDSPARGRPRGTSPNGNPPGSDGNPLFRVRLKPTDLEAVHAAGGASWAREVLLSALPRQVNIYTCMKCPAQQLTAGPCENCGGSVDVDRADLAELPANLRDLYRLENGLRIL